MDTKSFFELDFNSSLFPLKTNLLLIQHHHEALGAYIEKILSTDPLHLGDNFLAQTRAQLGSPKRRFGKIKGYRLSICVPRESGNLSLARRHLRNCGVKVENINVWCLDKPLRL